MQYYDKTSAHNVLEHSNRDNGPNNIEAYAVPADF